MKLDVFFTFKKCGNVGFRPVLAEQKPRRDSKLLTLDMLKLRRVAVTEGKHIQSFVKFFSVVVRTVYVSILQPAWNRQNIPHITIFLYDPANQRVSYDINRGYYQKNDCYGEGC